MKVEEMALSRDELLAIRPTSEAVEIPGHGKVFVKGLTAKERDDYEQSLVEVGPDGRTRAKSNQENVRARLVVRAICDESGERLFSDADVGEVGGIDGAVIDQIWDAARRLSGMETETVDVTASSFDSAQDDGSSSA